MNSWLPDQNSHAGFGNPNEGAMSFLQPPQTINPAQFQNPNFMNGAPRTSSPSFHNPMYQTNQVIPSKRTREDSLGASPRQMPGGLPASRSQTTGQSAFAGFNPQANGSMPMPNAPSAFQHLQSPSNATPSPTLQQMSFNQGGNQQRIATASPNVFSPPQVPPHNSPAPSEHASRVGTPHDNPQAFMGGSTFGPGFNQPQFGPNVNTGMSQAAMNPGMNIAQAQQQQQQQQLGISAAHRNYQMQMQAQARQLQAQAQAQSRGQNGMAPNPNTANTQVGGQISAQQRANLAPPRPTTVEEFIKGLQTFMASRGQTVDINPIICGQRMALPRLYAAVVKAGGSQKISKLNLWGFIAQQLGFQAPQHQQAATELQNYWASNLAPYESAWQMSQQKQRIAAQAAMQNQGQAPLGQPGQDGAASNHQRTQSEANSLKVESPIPGHAQQPMVNGFGPSQSLSNQQSKNAGQGHRSNLSQQFDQQQVQFAQGQVDAQVGQKRPESSAGLPQEANEDVNASVKVPIEDPFRPDVLPPSKFHGPVIVDEFVVLGQHIADLRPTVPSVRELGIIDVHALTMAIKSGMHAETRTALDTLVTLSTESSLQLSLTECDDLMETLVECAQDQVEFLAEHAVEVSDEMLLSSYEEVVRACRMEAELIQNIPAFGTVEYDLDRAADRLICITTLIRNFSFYEANFVILGQSEVLKILSSVIRYLGTTEMLLRNNRNTLDFMKDVIIYLSNLSTSLNIPGREEALCLLHFLLAFAPSPAPFTANTDKISFSAYNPNLHKYMPSAVDSLAKLLARDEPNRTYYKTIFAADANSSPPYELLTRTFGLAIAPVPNTPINTMKIIEARRPSLLQGMLAAEILAGIVPTTDAYLAKAWLESEDAFAAGLLRMVNILSGDRTLQTQAPHPQQQQSRSAPETDINAYGAISMRALSVLKILVQKARTVDIDGRVIIPAGILPKKEAMLIAMSQREMDKGLLRQLCIYSGLED